MMVDNALRSQKPKILIMSTPKGTNSAWLWQWFWRICRHRSRKRQQAERN